MKILVLDELGKHGSDCLGESINVTLNSKNEESQLVKSLEQAYAELEKKETNLVIIHHYDFHTIKDLKIKYPFVKFAAFSGTFDSISNCEKDSVGYSVYEKFRQNYDFLITEGHRSLKEILDSLHKVNQNAN